MKVYHTILFDAPGGTPIDADIPVKLMGAFGLSYNPVDGAAYVLGTRFFVPVDNPGTPERSVKLSAILAVQRMAAEETSRWKTQKAVREALGIIDRG